MSISKHFTKLVVLYLIWLFWYQLPKWGRLKGKWDLNQVYICFGV
jgi:hypothetical protein